MSTNNGIDQADRTRKLRHLHELIAALDRRVPQVERLGEIEIAREGHALREKALQRIAELKASLGTSQTPAPLPATAKQTATSAPRIGRGPVDAPGKHHRKPPPQEPIDKRMGEPRGKQMGQKSVKAGRRG